MGKTRKAQTGTKIPTIYLSIIEEASHEEGSAWSGTVHGGSGADGRGEGGSAGEGIAPRRTSQLLSRARGPLPRRLLLPRPESPPLGPSGVEPGVPPLSILGH